MSGELRGLYVLADRAWHGHDPARVEAALRGGARLVQYRDKTETPDLPAARAIRDLCRRYQRRLFINDHVDLARAIDADGVHLGKDDLSVAEARKQLGPRFLIGASCYDSLEIGEAALAQGADYLAFGCFYPSATKPNATTVSLARFIEARRRFSCPLVAIGGITPENGRPLVAAGADALAVAAGVFGAPDPQAAAGRYAQLFVEA